MLKLQTCSSWNSCIHSFNSSFILFIGWNSQILQFNLFSLCVCCTLFISFSLGWSLKCSPFLSCNLLSDKKTQNKCNEEKLPILINCRLCWWKKKFWDEHLLSFSTSSQIIMSLDLACVAWKRSALINAFVVANETSYVSDSFFCVCVPVKFLLLFAECGNICQSLPLTDSISLIEVFLCKCLAVFCSLRSACVFNFVRIFLRISKSFIITFE